MNFLTTLFSNGAAVLIDSIGNAIDKTVTSDEEKLKLKNALSVEMNKLEKAQLDAVAAYDKEVTVRHKTDMRSDSWLSKNIRPCVLAFLIVSTVLLAYLSIFILDADKSELIAPWVELLKVLDIAVIGFYFGSRGLEKVQGIKAK